MKKTIAPFLFILMLALTNAAAQTNTDSLKQNVTQASTSKQKIEALKTLIETTSRNSTKETLQYIYQLKAVAQAAQDKAALSFSNRQLAVYKRNSNENDSAFYFVRQAFQYSSGINNISEQANNYITLAGLYGQKQMLDSSEYVYKQVAAMQLPVPDLHLKAIAYSGISQRRNNHDDYTTALRYADSSIAILQKTNDEKRMASPYRQKSTAYNALGNYDSATYYCKELIRIAEKHNDFSSITDGYLMQGRIYKLIDENLKAEQSFKKAFEVADKNKLTFHLSFVIKEIINIYRKTKQDDSLMVYLEIFKNKFSSIMDKDLRVLESMGGYYFDKGMYPQAKETFLKVQQALTKGGREFDKMFNQMHLADTYESLGMPDSALYYMKNYLAKAQAINNPEELRKANGLMAAFYERQNNYAAALTHHKKYKELGDTLLAAEKLKSVAEIETRYETEKKVQQIKQLQNEQQLAAVQLQLRSDALEKEKLINNQKSTELELSSKDNEIKTLTVQQQSLALQNQKTTNEKTEQQLVLSQKETELKNAELSKASLKQKIAVGGIAALLVIGFYVFTLYQKRKTLSNKLSQSLTELKQTQTQLIQLEKEKEAEAIRLRISRDIHDDIGSNLTKIAMLGNLASVQSKVKMPEMTEQLDKISDYARTVNSSMSEIIWAVNPKQDTLENLLAYMRVHTEEFLKDTGINHKINFPEVIPNIQLNPDLKRSLFLVLKESLNNAVKYAEAKNIEVTFTTREVSKTSRVSFEMKITDDGKGFNVTEKLNTGNGLQNMNERIKQVGCEFNIQSSQSNGCAVTVNGLI